MGRRTRCALLSLLLLGAPRPAAADARDDFLQEASAAVAGAFDTVSALSGATPLPSGATLVSRSVHHPDLAAAEDYCLDRLQTAGATVWTEEATATDLLPAPGGGDPVAVEVSGLRTVVAELAGADPSLPPLYVSAHLDSTASADDGWDPSIDPAPGADDDASGVSLVLALAEAAASHDGGFARTLRFVLFTAEETGLDGSRSFVDDLDPADGPDLLLQLDPVGYNGGDLDRLWFSYDPRWPESVDLVADAAARAGTFLDVQGVDRELLGSQAERSDHAPFWEAGYRAIHFGSFPPPPDYHRQTDTVAVVDPEFLVEVGGVLAELVADVATPLPPVDEDPGQGCACGVSGHEGPAEGGSLLGLVLATALAPRRRRQR